MIRIYGLTKTSENVHYCPVEGEWRTNPETFEVDQFTGVWVDLEKPTEQDLVWLAAKFHFHPLSIEDCSHFDQRPKREQYPNYLFVVVHAIESGGESIGDGLGIELHTFLTSNAVVTVHDQPLKSLKKFREKLLNQPILFKEPIDRLYYRVFDLVVDEMPIRIEDLERELEELDSQILESQGRKNAFHDLHRFQSALFKLKQVITPQREIFMGFMEGASEQIHVESKVYFRDLFDHLNRVLDRLERLQHQLWSARELCIALQGQRTNETMRRLTVFSAIFLPLGFVTGFFGMNFEMLPIKSLIWFQICIGTILMLPFLMGWYLWSTRDS